jgi:hypothetical protein
MNLQEKKQLNERILNLISSLPCDADGWSPLAQLGSALNKAEIRYKELGYLKLRPFINEFSSSLELKDVLEPGKTPVCFVRPLSAVDQREEDAAPHAPEPTAPVFGQGERVPGANSWLFNWAFLSQQHILALSELALEEKWFYGNNPENNEFPILRNYLAYTFKRLCFEKKILFATDTARNEEYAAFNTGLVDRKYEYIYALFKRNTRFPSPYWFLLAFAVAGEDTGKTLVSLFNPLPERADYFENKVENMLYDTTTGNLSCDYTHILTERTHRLPIAFLEDNCPDEFLEIDGLHVSRFPATLSLEQRREYFRKLGEKIKATPRILNRLKNRMDDAVNLALKRTEWNYKTAIPMYYPARNAGSLLLPLTLVDEDHVDLALVVERQPSGSYQGQTILPLDLAYSNSRLVCRPDSDWLRTDLVCASEPDDSDSSGDE